MRLNIIHVQRIVALQLKLRAIFAIKMDGEFYKTTIQR